ncbi:hypothetical protein [Seonamhaeicola aphaedonensis]|uniref:Uncharacterized protein n=1 Tax=Seonamhaeicola aphaedonensis TaxID=1461338 RepID=A0A3D9HLG0_9FLAO|nr:hypothetical protein [Seonamhaeicola aphaedonensis]RED50308.1 hypothetical protein DFQ02_101336 [Seonamhaeicola aphaedonensis]
MKTAVFKSYQDGLYTFWFDNGDELAFEEVHPKALYKYNLKTDKSFIDKSFKLSYSEVFNDLDDSVIYRIDSLVLL